MRDYGLLESALAMPQAAFSGEFLHKDVFEMAAAYLFHIVQNHPFVDGNKRTGTTVSYIFLKLNGFHLKVDPDLLEKSSYLLQWANTIRSKLPISFARIVFLLGHLDNKGARTANSLRTLMKAAPYISALRSPTPFMEINSSMLCGWA